MKIEECLTLADQSELHWHKTFRTISNRRITMLAQWQQQWVVAKIFFSRHAKRHLKKNLSGVYWLQAANITQPKLVQQTQDQEHACQIILFEFLQHALSIEQALLSQERDIVCHQLAKTLWQLHQANLRQSDLHLGNFLWQAKKIFVLDADSIKRYFFKLTQQTRLADLAQLMIQIPESFASCRNVIFKHYAVYEGADLKREDPMFIKIYKKVETQQAKRRIKRYLRDTAAFV